MFGNDFREIGTVREAKKKLIKAITKISKRPPVDGADLTALITAYQRVTSEEAQAELYENGMAPIFDAIEQPIATPKRGKDGFEPIEPLVSPMLVALRVLSPYEAPRSLFYTLKKIEQGLEPNSFFWEEIFKGFDPTGVSAQLLISQFNEEQKLPSGFCAVSLLGFCNFMALQK